MAALRLCSIPDCGKPVHGHDFCPAHYGRWRRYGDPMSGRTARGAPAIYLKETVLPYRGDACLIWPYARLQDGRAEMRHSGRTVYVSRLVCETIQGPPPTPKHEAAHSCGNGHGGCVTPLHLSWKLPNANHADKIRHGTTNRGTKSPMSKLTNEDVRKIRALQGIVTQKELALMFGVTKANISAIHTGRSWGWLQT